ncbi:hypothetical protein F1880_000545 [Penicillium rolfsii]|nr:hypothetical protein F1880_000545 [Penicillium rolfsii]
MIIVSDAHSRGLMSDEHQILPICMLPTARDSLLGAPPHPETDRSTVYSVHVHPPMKGAKGSRALPTPQQGNKKKRAFKVTLSPDGAR